MAVTDEAIESIKAMIVTGELAPGQRLPREADLADRLGLSRNSLREAVKALELINVLDVRRGDGTYVTSLDVATLMSPLGFLVDLHRDDSVLHFLEVRRLLEPSATALAAQRISADDLARLRAVQSGIEAADSIDDLVRADIEFHRLIALGSGNPVIASLLDSLTGPTQRARVWRGLHDDGAVAKTINEHNQILDALVRRDVEAARSWSLIHVSGIESWLRGLVEAGHLDTTAARPPAGVPAAIGG